MEVRRKKIRRILTKLRGGEYSRAASGGGEMRRFEEEGEEVYRMGQFIGGGCEALSDEM